MDRLYFKHKSRMETVENKINKFKLTNDDIYLDEACFECQQSLEFLLKSILIEFNIDYPIGGIKGHNIKLLMSLLNQINNFKFDYFDDLYKLSDTITFWETNARYGEAIKTKINTVERAKNLIKNLDLYFIKFIE